MQITNRQQPFQVRNNQGQAKKRPLANPFSNVHIQSSPPDNDFERLDSYEQSNYGNTSYNTESTMTGSFSPDRRNYDNGREYEQQSSVSFNHSYQQNTQNTRSVDMRDQNNYSRGPSEDFAGFAPGAQAIQVPVAKANSMLGTVFGFASMFMGNNQGNNGRQTTEYDEENEPPLLEDLGIDLKLIKMRALSVLKFEKCNEEFVKEADMSGPLLLFLTLGSLLLFSGKVHFGYIYGFGVIGTVAVYLMMNLISQVYKVQLYNTMSILGYCLFPIVVLAFFNVFFSLVNFIGFVLSAGAVIWATLAATNFFQVLLNLDQQKWLIAYPILLFYKVFVIITIF